MCIGNKENLKNIVIVPAKILKNVEECTNTRAQKVLMGLRNKQKTAWMIPDMEIVDDLISSRWILVNLSAPLKPLQLYCFCVVLHIRIHFQQV